MRYELCIFGLLSVGLMAGQVLAQSPSSLQVASLCELQAKTAQGEHRTVRVEGVYSAGLENQNLVSSACSGQSTAVEFALKSHRLSRCGLSWT